MAFNLNPYPKVFHSTSKILDNFGTFKSQMEAIFLQVPTVPTGETFGASSEN